MSIIAIAFLLFLISALLVLVQFGGWEGRMIALASVLATILTYVANGRLGFGPAQPFVLAFDTALLFAGVTVALFSGKYWPMWFAGFHMVAVASGGAGQLFPGVFPRIYSDVAGFWAIPALGAAVLGILRDRSSQIMVQIDNA